MTPENNVFGGAAPPVYHPKFEEIIKFNLLQLVKDHRAKCDEHCNVSLMLILEIATRAGIWFTDDERKLFI